MTTNSKHPPGPPLTLANMRESRGAMMARHGEEI
jgi:hypothetical protein